MRDNMTCWMCKERIDLWEASVDHIWPRSKGGPDALWNTALACIPCNNSKGDSLPPGLVRALMDYWGWNPVELQYVATYPDQLKG